MPFLVRSVIWVGSMLLVGCASEPPLLDQEAPPPTIAGLVQDRVGPFRTDARPTATWAAMQARPPFKKAWWRGQVAFVSFDGESPILGISYLFDRNLNAESYEEAELRLVYVEMPTEGDQAELNSQLDATGLMPRRVVGVDRERFLLLATDRPEWFARYRGDRLTGLVRQLPGQSLRDTLEVVDLDALRALEQRGELEELGAWLVAADVPTAAPDDPWWHDAVASMRGRVDAQLVKPFTADMATLDRRMAGAKTLLAKLDVFKDMYPVVKRASHDRKSAVQPVLDWMTKHRATFFTQMNEVFDGEAKKSTAVWGIYRFIGEALDLKRWTNKHIGTPQWHGYRPALEYAEAWARIRDVDPYRELARRLRWLPGSKVPRSTRRYYYAEAARQRCLERRRATDPEAWEVALLEILQKATFPNTNSMRGWAGLADEASAAGRLFARPPSDLQAECAGLAAIPKSMASRIGVRKAVWSEAAKRLDMLSEVGSDADQAVARALAATLREAMPEGRNATSRSVDAARKATASAPAILLAVRALPQSGDVEMRVAAYAGLANRGAEFGSVAERIAAELSVPAGRALAADAKRAAAEGYHAFAAVQWLRAATLGRRTLPTPISSWSVRRSYAALQAARKAGELDGRDERADWLTEARMHAYAAAVTMLPRLDVAEPIYDLQSRFVAAQLAGRCRLPRAFGVRLNGMADVRRGRKDSENRQLGRSQDRVMWLADGDEGEAIDLANYRIDAAGWRDLRKKRAELDQVDADLKAARKSRGSSRAQLEAQDRELSTQAQALQEQLNSGAVDPGYAQGEIARLRRESSALSSAIANFNDRNRHINSLADRYNELVGPHNALLEKLLKQQATAYAELLRPATDLYVELQVQAGTLEPRERRARRWLMGLIDDAEIDSILPQPHPVALAQRVRDVSDPAIAATDILEALRRRRDDQRLWRGVTVGQHVEALRSAFVAYGSQYGVDDLHERVMQKALVPADEHGRIVGFFKDKRRAALQKLVKGGGGEGGGD